MSLYGLFGRRERQRRERMHMMQGEAAELRRDLSENARNHAYLPSLREQIVEADISSDDRDELLTELDFYLGEAGAYKAGGDG